MHNHGICTHPDMIPYLYLPQEFRPGARIEVIPNNRPIILAVELSDQIPV
jgi:hypothetical protein